MTGQESERPTKSQGQQLFTSRTKSSQCSWQHSSHKQRRRKLSLCSAKRIKVSHRNFFTFLAHLQRATTDYMNDLERVTNGLNIRRPKKSNIRNDARIKSCIERYDYGRYSRLQFLQAVSHNLGAHIDALNDVTSDED